ncbi:hypothetical protein JMN32_15070 [Fulvivirga sp. 29W222]|uniref:Zinc finger CHC2-type domain-containing protein n=1 Tax=Fulvivirga marina TaxID=2494733 RepID=A0A937G034_9BACT|nr:CHC2 zinc finger domain-containing protein [Fulvivirga marina]MBL6447638.1 hypothetical protein [Fulvivirga marina]
MEIKEIKAQLSITTVLQHYNLQPTGKGALQCPFHETKPGSRKKTLQVYTDTNRYQCFHKDCSAGNGDVIDFIMYMETKSATVNTSADRHEAIQKAKALLGVKAPKSKDTQDAHSDVCPGPTGASGTPRHPEELGSGVTFTIINKEQLHYRDGSLEITVLGGIRLEGLDRMRCTLKLASATQPHRPALRHTLDLYNDDQLQKLTRKAATHLELGTSKITTSLYQLLDHLENYRLEANARQEEKPRTPEPSPEARQQALNFLQHPDLMERTNTLLGQSGITGEDTNRQILWLVYGSRKRPKPLHVICLGASGTGKTYLQEKVARFIPESEKFTFTASSENAFYYLEPYDLCHKVVLVEDMDGAQSLLYPLRELQTKQWISKVVPIKDSQGNIKTRKLEVYGPISLSGTTTHESLYEDNANRCLLLHLDTTHRQQESIMDYQRKQSAGKIDTIAEHKATQLLQNIQQVLAPIKIVNPYAEHLRIPGQCFKPLRTHEHYLQFIETVTWYHQYQRPEQADPETGEVYINTTLEDIAIANKLLKDILLTKSDELPQALRHFFEQLKNWLRSQNQESFYSKTLRTHFRTYPMKINRYIRTLEQYGYLQKTGGNRKQGYEYEITDWEDYTRLQAGVNILDELLKKLKSTKTKAGGKYNTSITTV